MIAATMALSAEGSLKVAKGPATAMAGLEGEACPKDEYERYKTIVCNVEETCKCADTLCELDWCAEYVHNWKKEFGACNLKGCEAGENTAEEPKSEEEKDDADAGQ